MAAVLDEVGGASGAVDEFVEDEKPTWDDDIDIGDIVPPSDDDERPAAGPSNNRERKKEKRKDKKKRKKDADAEEEDGVDIDMMDADAPVVVDAGGEDEWDGTEEMRKRVLDKYMDEIHGLEFNDMVHDYPLLHPTRSLRPTRWPACRRASNTRPCNPRLTASRPSTSS
jgi:protein KRI1